MQRRTFIKHNGMLSGAVLASPALFASDFSRESLHIACQSYTWTSFLKRENKEWNAKSPKRYKRLSQAGIEGFEPSYTPEQEIEAHQAGLAKRNIQTRSLYVNSVLHEEEKWENSITEIIGIAKRVQSAGIEIIVTNPQPIAWGSDEAKDDTQLRTQAKAMNVLGKALYEQGMQLAYHTHDKEMHNSAREFHHTLLATDPQYVNLCLDAHWVYRGAGDSQVALFDIAKLYADRIVELHIRQSQAGIWTEVFGEGDIDYPALVELLLKQKVHPHLVMEQAAEKGTPQTLSAVEAIRQSMLNARAVFQPFAG